MKLTKVRSLSDRPASNLSVIVQFLFDRHMPGEFIPGHPYKKGDTVYTISEDGLSIKLWTCNIAGSYPNTTEPFWTELSISTYLDMKLEKIVKRLYDPHPQMYTLTQSIGTYMVPRLNSELSNIEHTPAFMDVFYDGLLVSPQNYEIIDGELKSLVMPVEDDVIIDNYSPCHDLSRLIRRTSYSIAMSGNTVTLPTKKIQQYVSYGYDLYVNGRYIDPTQYTESTNGDGDIVITFNDNIPNGENNVCVANFTMSVSENITIAHTVLSKEIQRDMDSYDIDITESGYINVYQTMAIYVDGKRMDSSKFHFSKGFLNVKSQNDYLARGSVISVSVMSYIPTEYNYANINHEDRRYITESIYTVENNTRLIPVPFMEFSEDLDDFLLFNENGAFISSAKWFIDQNYVHYYPHDQGVYIGDTINFKMVDRNKNTIMRTFILTAEDINQQEFELPFNSDGYMFKMLFYSSGCYLSPLEYTMDGNRLMLTHNMSLEPGDRLEIVAFKYADEIGSTVMDYKRIFVNEEVANTFKLDFQFDRAVTSFMIFANTGLYIGEKFYDISDDNILTIKGEEVYEGGWLDIVVTQSTAALTSADNILGLL